MAVKAGKRHREKAAAAPPADHRGIRGIGGTYGYRIAAQLALQGVVAGLELVRRLMRDLGLVACQPRPWRSPTTQQGAAGPIADLAQRDFTAEEPGQKMVGDITCIATWEGWEYLATVIDCATLKENIARMSGSMLNAWSS